jgi:hypothetical protein
VAQAVTYDALDDIVNNVQADYFVDKATNKTVKKKLETWLRAFTVRKVEKAVI